MSKKSAKIILERCPVTDLKTAVIKIEKIILPTSDLGVRKIFAPKIKREINEEPPEVVKKTLIRRKIKKEILPIGGYPSVWEKDFPWICPDPEDSQSKNAYCTICCKVYNSKLDLFNHLHTAV